MQPMLYIIQTFGIQMSVYIDCLLLKEAFSQLSHLINIYEENLPKIQLSFQEYSKNNVNNSISQTFPIELIKSAASALLSFGLILALRDMLNSAVVEITESALPGFQDLVQSAVTHINRKLSDPECAFLEATAPGITNKFFVTHAESIIKNQIEPSPFFYFLGVLMSNPEWEKLSFDIEKDLFTPNLQLIALSLERIIDLSPIIFAGSTDVKIQHSILLYFSAVSSICEGMKSKSSQCYQAFIVLMDHFPSLTSNILYGHMEEAFPYSIIRGCYNELAQQYRRSKRNNSNIE
ncbi:hypothetical protein TRFO_31315 [Tritrichomonas foetus]|uniref:Uncharacterized protein n=1 Tax=Tritrichomonas foetus TaxID=1144522 RepID=A0A1J4JRH7_9EUKA|nr:hypothetical protein TRFO_31315 [Tritrichomonas foetus]|eukprot:OHT01751.1 hypothetical protein TRFO_31315 [Tritrichomonas foetus]